MTHPLNTGTWRWDPACATWVFELTAAPGQPLIDAMAACARRMLAALPGFAIPATAEWTTESGGEEQESKDRFHFVSPADFRFMSCSSFSRRSLSSWFSDSSFAILESAF